MSEQISQCEQCQQRFHLFRRKKSCDLCGQNFCSKCLSKSRLNSSRSCPICLIITNENTTRDQLASIRIKHLRAYLIHSKIISTNRLESLIEKQDLIHLIESKRRRIPDETYVFVQPLETNFNPETVVVVNNQQQEREESIVNESEPVSSLSNGSSASSYEPLQESNISSPLPPSTKAQFDRVTVSELSSLESIHDLTIRQLKDILIQNFVSTKGCVEKKELIDKVELLYRDQEKQFNSTINNSSTNSSENVCKVCMDNNIDCVFLDCGHLCTCIQCGKRLSECPLCRSYIVRVVRVFKS